MKAEVTHVKEREGLRRTVASEAAEALRRVRFPPSVSESWTRIPRPPCPPPSHAHTPDPPATFSFPLGPVRTTCLQEGDVRIKYGI